MPDHPMPAWRRVLCVSIGLALCYVGAMFFAAFSRGSPKPALVFMGGAALMGVGGALIWSGVRGR